MIKKKYLFFDMDGVLIDSMKYHVKSWQHALKENGIKVETQRLKAMGGVPFRQTIITLAKEHDINVSEKEIQKIYDYKIQLFQEQFKIKIFPRMLETLKLLKSKNFKLALVSGSVRDCVTNIINNSFQDIFDYVVCGDDIKRGKPFPDPYLNAQKHFNAKKEECIVVEDAVLGVESAINASIDVVAVASTLPPKELSKANHICKNHKDLIDYLNKL